MNVVARMGLGLLAVAGAVSTLHVTLLAARDAPEETRLFHNLSRPVEPPVETVPAMVPVPKPVVASLADKPMGIPIPCDVMRATSVDAGRSMVAAVARHDIDVYRDCAAFDLDGDGVEDRLEVIAGSCGTGGCSYEAYVARPAGDEFVGRFDAKTPLVLVPGSGRYADVFAYWRGGAVDLHVTRFQFRGRSYREISGYEIR